MKSKYLFYILTVLLIGFGYFSFEMGFIKYLWYADLSKLSFIIIALLVKAVSWLGYLVHRDKPISDEDIDVGYETGELSMGLGMLGTVIGFIMMTTSFAGVDISSVENIKQLFELATAGMSTALLTTAVGLFSSLVLRVSYYLTERLR